MDTATVRAMLMQNFEYAGSDPILAHKMYHDDAVLEFPQSGERFVGVENFSEWRSAYPASVDFEIGEIRGGGDVWVAEISARYDEGPAHFGVSIHEFRDDRIARETDLRHRRLGGAGVARPVESRRRDPAARQSSPGSNE